MIQMFAYSIAFIRDRLSRVRLDDAEKQPVHLAAFNEFAGRDKESLIVDVRTLRSHAEAAQVHEM